MKPESSGRYVYVGFEHEIMREEILAEARRRHPHGLLVCSYCRFAFLTDEAAKADFGCEVICADEYECFRRRRDLVGPPAEGWRVDGCTEGIES